MATSTKSRRRQERFAVNRTSEASVEFAHAGRLRSMALHNLSASGVSFASEAAEDFAGLEIGLRLDRAVVRLGEDCTIRGDLVVMHISETGVRQICGALFYPATDGDLVKLKSAVEGMHAVRSPEGF
jgi:hypothetical protein